MRAKEFSSIAEFALHIAAIDLAVQLAAHKALERAAKLVEKAAKDEIGHYQDAVGPFPAWAPLAESTEASKAAHGYPSGAPLLATGKMRDNITHAIEGNDAVIGSPDERAVFHEFGTSKMPPRPVFGPAVFSNKNRIQSIMGKAVVEGIIGGEIAPGGGSYFLGE